MFRRTICLYSKIRQLSFFVIIIISTHLSEGSRFCFRDHSGEAQSQSCSVGPALGSVPLYITPLFNSVRVAVTSFQFSTHSADTGQRAVTCLI